MMRDRLARQFGGGLELAKVQPDEIDIRAAAAGRAPLDKLFELKEAVRVENFGKDDLAAPNWPSCRPSSRRTSPRSSRRASRLEKEIERLKAAAGAAADEGDRLKAIGK